MFQVILNHIGAKAIHHVYFSIIHVNVITLYLYYDNNGLFLLKYVIADFVNTQE